MQQEVGRSDFKEARRQSQCTLCSKENSCPDSLHEEGTTVTAASWLSWAPIVSLALQSFPMTLRRLPNSSPWPAGALLAPHHSTLLLPAAKLASIPPIHQTHTCPRPLPLLFPPSGMFLSQLFPWLVPEQMPPPPEGFP